MTNLKRFQSLPNADCWPGKKFSTCTWMSKEKYLQPFLWKSFLKKKWYTVNQEYGTITVFETVFLKLFCRCWSPFDNFQYLSPFLHGLQRTGISALKSSSLAEHIDVSPPVPKCFLDQSTATWEMVAPHSNTPGK